MDRYDVRGLANGCNGYRTAPLRRIAIDSFSAVEGGHQTHALLELDITGLRSTLRAQRRSGTGGSLFAFMLKAIAESLTIHREFNAMVHRGRVTLFDTVDISLPIEVVGAPTHAGYIVRAADSKTVAAIDAEVNAARTRAIDTVGFVRSERTQNILSRLPQWVVVIIIRFLLRNHERVRRLSGTVFVTSVSMTTGLSGFIVPYIGGPKACAFVVGGTVRKPAVIGKAIEIREFISLTASFNHDLVDGAPAARFVATLRRLVERDYEQLYR